LGSRRRSAPDSDIQVAQRLSQPAAAARPQPSSAPELADNPFASLEQETTRAFQVSDELLKQARESAAVANGATRAYEVPAELLEMARRKKLARAAASLKPSAPPKTSDVEQPQNDTEVIDVTQTGPRLAFSELSDEDRAWVESALVPAPPSETIERSHVRAVQRPQVAPKKSNSARWVFISLCVVAISAVAIQYARLSNDRQFPWSLGWDNDTSLGGLLSSSDKPRVGTQR
jgi:hypothetical protein